MVLQQVAHELQEGSDQPPQPSLAPPALCEDASYPWFSSSSVSVCICSSKENSIRARALSYGHLYCGIISSFCPYQSALSQTTRGNGFKDSTGQGWFPEATAFLRGREFKFVDVSDLTSYLLFACLLQHKNVQSCRYLQGVK